MSRPVHRWPLAVIAAPAAVSIWSGWVGLGALCGFGDVQPLPGILPWHLDTALTLPLGIESYAALALGTWLRPGTLGTAKAFARGSAIGALALGMLGQVSYHLLAAGHAVRAPDLVIVLVACLPVVVLGCAVALLHLLSADNAAAAAAAAAREARRERTSHRAPAPARGKTGAAKGVPADRSPAAIKAAIEAIDPPVTGAKVGELLGASERTGRRYLQSVSGQDMLPLSGQETGT